MKRDSLQEREWAVEKFHTGDSPNSICISLGRSPAWLYKWVNRYKSDDPYWNRNDSKAPKTNPRHTPKEIEEAVKFARLHLYNQDLFCGAEAIRWEMEDMGIQPMPSPRTINRILARNHLTHRRTGRYLPKGTSYPYLLAKEPNQVQQADFVVPLFIKGPLRFYSLNNVDVATARCGIGPLVSRASQGVINAFWSVWWRIGIPQHIQVDNEMSFYGSPTHPRGMGALIRLCLHNDIEPWFIPMKGPWRNGIIEKFSNYSTLSQS
jgi:hypothetical protein